jgi:hypothetical protein
MAPPPNSLLCFSRAITYVKKQRKLLGSGAITDGETDAKNAIVDGPLNCTIILIFDVKELEPSNFERLTPNEVLISEDFHCDV